MKVLSYKGGMVYFGVRLGSNRFVWSACGYEMAGEHIVSIWLGVLTARRTSGCRLLSHIDSSFLLYTQSNNKIINNLRPSKV
jgi:hypothetical protein